MERSDQHRIEVTEKILPIERFKERYFHHGITPIVNQSVSSVPNSILKAMMRSPQSLLERVISLDWSANEVKNVTREVHVNLRHRQVYDFVNKSSGNQNGEAISSVKG